MDYQEEQPEEMQEKENSQKQLENTNQEISNNDITYQNASINKKQSSPNRQEFILDCDNRKKSRLPNYNGLTDKYLTPFFQNSNIRNNLLKAGLINDQNEIIETKKTVVVPFRKLDPIVQRKHICHVVPKRKAVSNTHYQQMSQSSHQGSKCFSMSQNKKIYLYDKLPPLKAAKQGSKIHLPEIYLEKNFHQFATQYLEFLQNNSIDLNQSLERQFIEKYKTQQRKKIIRHYIPLHTQVRGVKEDCLSWKFQTELNNNNNNNNQSQKQQEFGLNKNNFYKSNQQNNCQQQQQDEDEKYSDEEFDKEDKKSDYDDEFESDQGKKEKSDQIDEEGESNNYGNNSNYDDNDDVDDFEDDDKDKQQKRNQKNDDDSDYGQDFEDEEDQNKKKNDKIDNDDNYEVNDFEDDEEII